MTCQLIQVNLQLFLKQVKHKLVLNRLWMLCLCLDVLYFIENIEIFMDKGQEVLNLEPILKLEVSILGVLVEGIKKQAYTAADPLL
jgi:hypothetical protein